MSSRDRPLSEQSQSQFNATPSRYAPSTPHAIRALQERSSAKRSARSARSINRTIRKGNPLDQIRPDGSARNILKQFAKITAPVTKKRVVTPNATDANKENALPDGEDDSIITRKPYLTFNIDESVEEDDSEIPVAPTPSALLADDSDDDTNPPTATFQNLGANRDVRAMSEKIDRRQSRVSLFGAPEHDETGLDQDGDATIMTERGRRALSEEATARLSRYSFGSIRMRDFGSELEIRRESDRQDKVAELEGQDDYGGYDQDDNTDYYGDDTLRRTSHSPTDFMNESMQFQGAGDDSFSLPVPGDQPTETMAYADHGNADVPARPSIVHETQPEMDSESDRHSIRRQTRLEMATDLSHKSRKKRVKLTRHGTTVPSLPSSLIKRVATEVQTKQGKRKPKFGKDHMKALEQATEWFFEQVGEDLAAYSSHGRRRKRVDLDDALLLMKRQRSMEANGGLERLATEWLAKEISDELDLD